MANLFEGPEVLAQEEEGGCRSAEKIPRQIVRNMKDLLHWMLSHEPDHRPLAAEALKHPEEDGARSTKTSLS